MTKSFPLPLLLICVALIAAAGLRGWNLTAHALWLDEGYSAYAAAKGFAFLWQVVPTYETHPPFYYSLVRLWTMLFGDSLLSLRLLGTLAGWLSVPMAGLAAHYLARFSGLEQRQRWWLIACAMLLVALLPASVWMARQVRPYPLMMLGYSVGLAMLFALARQLRDGEGFNGPAYYGWLINLAALLWLHNLGVVYAGTLGLALLLLALPWRWSKADWTRFISGHLLVALVWAPALYILLDQAPTWIGSTWLKFNLTNALTTIKDFWTTGAMAAVIATLLLACAALVWRPYPSIALIIAAALPVLISISVSIALAPVFIPRIMTPVAIPAMLLFALGAVLLAQRYWWLALPAILVLLSYQGLIAWRITQNPPFENWRGALAWLSTRIKPGDQVFAYPNEGALPFRYAVRDARLNIITRSIPSEIPSPHPGPGAWHPTGSRGVFSLSRPQLEAIARAPDSQRVPTIWLLRLGPLAYDKGDQFLAALKRDRIVVGHYQQDAIDLIGLKRPDVSTAPSAPLPQSLPQSLPQL
jgi:mannosyltransferase